MGRRREDFGPALKLLQRKRDELVEREKVLKGQLEGLELAIRIVGEVLKRKDNVD